MTPLVFSIQAFSKVLTMNYDNGITTVNGGSFSYERHCHLAREIWVRWGCDTAAAAAAWRRLFQNSCPDSEFIKMVKEVIENG